MITRQAQVISTEMVDTADGKRQYMKVVLRGNEGREGKQSVFDPAIQKVMTEAHRQGCWVENTLEKEGNFWNIKSSILLPNTPEPEGGVARPESGRRSDPYYDIKNRSVILSYAKDLVVAGKLEMKAILQCADRFADWLNGEQSKGKGADSDSEDAGEV